MHAAHPAAWGTSPFPDTWGGNQTLDIHRAFGGEFTVHFPAGATRQRLLDTLDCIRVGAIRVPPLVTHRIAGADFGEACRLLGDPTAEYLGIVGVWRNGTSP